MPFVVQTDGKNKAVNIGIVSAAHGSHVAGIAAGHRLFGGFKPQIIAPGAAISTTPMWQPGEPVPGTYVRPPGYGMFNGTSMSAPMAAGAAALLVSAAKQYGAHHKPVQLRQAMNSSTRQGHPSGCRARATEAVASASPPTGSGAAPAR